MSQIRLWVNVDATGQGERHQQRGESTGVLYRPRYACPARNTTELGWRPQYTDIRKTVETAWNWHRAHPNGFES